MEAGKFSPADTIFVPEHGKLNSHKTSHETFVLMYIVR